ncbi:MBL fold metallo-hydrolase [Solirubrobacter ginsenosidimutans]|uniref:MBL fold metallo-hydrolase n=1 Tax=Solirubrobacter ginsenosidimutans TaxID=490573 RepID=A0A9X3MXH3_9ACTN|nr:MBL fold metallo-hydrolase [Solirubrobacter ginsenosidimutans]MDA0164322.1 MBL fold metallo-hydrolase [Solirubrobacter ginsenosidimutans]
MPDDLTALRELERVPLGLPAGLELQWLGVAGYRLSFEGTTVLVDPYVSRAPLRSLLLRRPALPDLAALDRYVARADAILVGHTHWDHAVDAPALARRDGATVYGSESLAHLMRLHGLDSVVAEPYRAYEIGPFVVRFVPSRHSKLLFGRKVPFDGALSCEDLHGLHPGAYKCGDVFGIRIEVAGTSFYHQGSADLRDDERIDPVDVFLAGITGRQVTPHYWRRILPRLDPRVVVPTHYDNFFAPLERPLSLIRRVALTELPAEIRAVSSATTLAAVPRDPGRPRATSGG